jgi:hypothetical protein
VARVLIGAWMAVLAVFVGSLAFAATDDGWRVGGWALAVVALIAAAAGGALAAATD